MAMDPRLLAMMQMQQQMPVVEQNPSRQAVDPSPGEPNTIPDEMTDEDLLNNIHGQMTGSVNEVTGQDMKRDQLAVAEAPTDGNIAAFIEAWGEENLPDTMRPDGDGDDYVSPGDD